MKKLWMYGLLALALAVPSAAWAVNAACCPDCADCPACPCSAAR